MALDALAFKAAIEKLDGGAELYAYHVQSVETEKQRGIEESRKNNAEAAKLRKYKIALEKLGYQGDEAGVDDYISQLSQLRDKAGTADQTKMSLEQLSAEFKKLQDNFTKSQNDLSAEKTHAQEIKANADRRTMRSKLIETLTGKIYGHDFVADGLINGGQVVLGDNDQVMFIEGDNRIPFDEGVKKLLETRTDIVINSQRPGASSTPGRTTNKKYTPEQIQTMSREDVKANLADIKESLGITV